MSWTKRSRPVLTTHTQICTNYIFHLSFFRNSQFLSLITRLNTNIFDQAHPQIFNYLWICVNLCQHAKNRSILSIHSGDTVNSRVTETRLGTPLFDHAQPKNFLSTFNFYDLYQQPKNYTVSSICSGEMVDLKILEFDWLRSFWPISQKQDFSKLRICAGTQQTK